MSSMLARERGAATEALFSIEQMRRRVLDAASSGASLKTAETLLAVHREAAVLQQRVDSLQHKASELEEMRTTLAEAELKCHVLRGELAALLRSANAAAWRRSLTASQNSNKSALLAEQAAIIGHQLHVISMLRNDKRCALKFLKRSDNWMKFEHGRYATMHAQVFAAMLLQRCQRRRRRLAEQKALHAQESLESVTKLAAASTRAAEISATLDRQTNDARAKSERERSMVLQVDGQEYPLAEGLRRLLAATALAGAGGVEAGGSTKFFRPGIRELTVGHASAAALGITAYLKVDLFELFSRCMEGTRAIRAEFEQNGTEEDVECMRYILDGTAGSSSKAFSNGVRDSGRHGERLDDFVNHPSSKAAQLTSAHVAALRIYTTACFRSLNVPLRDTARETPHPFATTVFFLADAIRRLRAVHVDQDPQAENKQDAPPSLRATRQPSLCQSEKMDLWRGMQNVSSSADFEQFGGTELAPMSTTSDPAVAVAYGQSEQAMLFRIVSRSFMSRGADISFLSAFPGEREYLYPPLTFLEPTGRREVVEIARGGRKVRFTVVEVEPQM